MKPEIIIYGLPKGETERYMEDIMAAFPESHDQAKNQENVQRVITAASADGFHSFRVARWNGDAPDFVKAITI